MTESVTCLLSDAVQFINYRVTLAPDFTKFTFAGSVNIRCVICRPVKDIVLHAADLNIHAATLLAWPQCGAESNLLIPTIHLDAEAETVTLSFPEELPVGVSFLDIDYTGELNDKLIGFYRSSYADATGTKKYLATTQFEPSDARRALPCVDEPARKATFDVTLVVPEHMTALSNMPVRRTLHRSDGLKVVAFERTPVMSTYLLAFVVGELEYAETHTANGTCVRVYTVPGKSTHSAFALETGRRVLEFYNEYFKIPYPLPKLDMIAIPDFAAGAMENWGLVTYRENLLLADPANSSAAGYQRIAEVVAHELAHQWFGNLVTMQWWTHLWLNEGFATWMATFAMNALFPDWDVWTQFVEDECAGALALDELRSTHPVEVPVNHPSEVSQIFDAISYSKGAAIIRMIHDFIGAERFRTGLQDYLTKFSYRNTVTEDLWEALELASGMPVRDIMDTWTKQPGLPLITMSRTDWRQNSIHQERFLVSGAELTPEERAQRWNIPLSIMLSQKAEGTVAQLSMLCKSSEDASFRTGCAMFVESDPDEFFKLNAGQIAPVRVNYPDHLWKRLSRGLHKLRLDPIDRFGLIDDAAALTRSGRMTTAQLIRLLSYMTNETNYTVWGAGLKALGSIGHILNGTPDHRRFTRLARGIIDTITTRVGWIEQPNEPHTMKLLRGDILNAAARYGNKSVIQHAQELFAGHVSGASPVPPNLRNAVYGAAARNGNAETLETLRNLYERESLQEERLRLLSAMGRIRDLNLVQSVLDYALDISHVRAGDLMYVFSSAARSRMGSKLVWEFVTANWDRIAKQYSTGGLGMLSYVIESATAGFNRAADADIVEQFFKDHPAPTATRAIAETLETIRLNDAWYVRDKDNITEVLKEY